MQNLLQSIFLFLVLPLLSFSQNNVNTRTWYGGDSIRTSYASGELAFEVKGKYYRPVKKSSLRSAQLVRDFIPGYPVNWIDKYLSMEINVENKNKGMKARGADEKLTTEQKLLLRNADPGTNIIVESKDVFSNPVTGKSANRLIRISVTVIPETQAEFKGGNDALHRYFRDNISSLIPDKLKPGTKGFIVDFTVNESGNIVNINSSKSTGNSKTDNDIIKAIKQMPAWTPARDENGKKISQEFEFRIYDMMNSGC